LEPALTVSAQCESPDLSSYRNIIKNKRRHVAGKKRKYIYHPNLERLVVLFHDNLIPCIRQLAVVEQTPPPPKQTSLKGLFLIGDHRATRKALCIPSRPTLSPTELRELLRERRSGVCSLSVWTLGYKKSTSPSPSESVYSSGQNSLRDGMAFTCTSSRHWVIVEGRSLQLSKGSVSGSRRLVATLNTLRCLRTSRLELSIPPCSRIGHQLLWYLLASSCRLEDTNCDDVNRYVYYRTVKRRVLGFERHLRCPVGWLHAHRSKPKSYLSSDLKEPR
jgi:hypothetical protein